MNGNNLGVDDSTMVICGSQGVHHLRGDTLKWSVNRTESWECHGQSVPSTTAII